MKTLVTGGAGFIGSHLAEALCRRGAKVAVLDNLSLGNLQNLSWRKPGDDLEFIDGDVTDRDLLARVVPGCDYIFHHAALPSVPLSVEKPIETDRHTLGGTLCVLEAARHAGVKRVMFASTSAVYGNSDGVVNHEFQPVNPLSPYALQKFAGEKYAQLYYQLYQLETVSFRYFNVFGPRQSSNSPYSGVIARFCAALLQGNTPVIFGDGLQSRDFIYIENVVRANLLALETDAAKVAGKVYNIAGGQSITLLQLLEQLQQLTGQTGPPQFQKARPGDVRFSQADISAAQRDLGFRIATTWQEGLRETLDFYRRAAYSEKLKA